MSDFRIGDIDPVPADDHTLDDSIRAVKDFCKQGNRMELGFTRRELRAVLRCDNNTRTSLIEAFIKAEHFREKKDRRLYPQPSVFFAKHAEVHGEAVFTVKKVRCRKSDCASGLLGEECYVEVCSICRNSHTHHPTEEAAWGRIRRNGFHRGRKAHSLTQGASVA